MNRSLLPVLRELGDLKRVTSAGRQGSIASRAFDVAWGRLLHGHPTRDVALDMTAACLVATRLGDLDAGSLPGLGMPTSDIAAMHRSALQQIGSGSIDGPLLDALLDRCNALPALSGTSDRPAFVQALIDQPRAGATCPGKARIILGPPENHAEHCLVVAVYAVLLAEPGSDAGTAFLAALAHHFHNVSMADSGFAGETLLGPFLDIIMANATRAVLKDLPAALADRTVVSREVLTDVETAEGRAFHAGDVLDRVLEIEQHLARSRVSMDDILGDMALVHDGPMKPFHDRVLAEMGLG